MSFEKNLLIAIAVFATLGLQSSCKKKNDPPADCGCGTSVVTYNANNFSGTMVYYSYIKKWVISHDPSLGVKNNLVICNENQDSVKAAINSSSQTSTVAVRFTGQVKPACQGEDFGFVSGNTGFYYIEVSSLKRN